MLRPPPSIERHQAIAAAPSLCSLEELQWHDSQVRHVLLEPFRWRVRPRLTTSCQGIFDKSLAIVDDPSGVQPIVDDAVEPLSATVDRRGVPGTTSWCCDALRVEASSDIECRTAIDILLEYSTNDLCFGLVDRS